MSTYMNGSNGHVGLANQQWEPENPFLNDIPAPPNTAAVAPLGASLSSIQTESPFLSEYSGEVDAGGPRAQTYAELVSELSDSEFGEALEDLVSEASAVAEDRVSSETADSDARRFEAERAVRAYLRPIASSAEEMLEQMSQELTSLNLTSASESEVDARLERFSAPSSDISPVAEQFLGGLLKKAKNAVKAAAKVAGKLSSILPVNLILGKLKGLIRPLVERVLRVAINRVPAALQPVAKQLAKRSLGVTVSEAAEELESNDEAAAIDPAQLEHELDGELAGYVLDGESFEQEAATERAVAEEFAPTGDPLGELARSRRRLAERITTMRPTDDVQPVMEEFVPAVLAALRIGINGMGRPKVVRFLSGLVANLIKKYIGQEQATALSGALVDAGLRTVSLETGGESNRSVGYALGATVEDTISRLVQDAPTPAWESEEMLAAYTYEAFQQAASAHFPDTEIRDELHEAANSSGIWTLLPESSPPKADKRKPR